MSPVRRMIFEEKNSPASIVYYKIAEGNNYLTNAVKHTSVKSNIYLKYYKTLIIEKFDQKIIQQRHFLENEWMFKVALYGNTLDFVLINKILSSTNRTIEDRIDNADTFKGDGILKGTPKEKPFDFLVGLPVFENREIKQYYTKLYDNTPKLTLEDTYLESGRRIELFTGEHIYLKAQTFEESEIIVSYCTDTVVNRHDVVAITSTTKITELKEIYGQMISQLFTYYQFLTSSAWGVATRPAIRLEEYMSFPSLDVDLTENLCSTVDQFIKPFEDYYSGLMRSSSLPISNEILQNINNIINSTYNISGHELDLIDYVLNVSRFQFQENKQDRFIKKIDGNEDYLKKYIEVFFNEFKNIYTDEFLNVEVYSLNQFIAINFILSKTENHASEKIKFFPKNKNVGEILYRIANTLSISSLIKSDDSTKNLFIQKDIKGFEQNSFYIIKPNEYKCWHRAMAWYDVAEIKNIIQEAEINYLRNTANV